MILIPLKQVIAVNILHKKYFKRIIITFHAHNFTLQILEIPQNQK